MEHFEAGSSQPNARTIGIVYLLYFLAAFLGAFLMNGLVAPGDAAATANGMLAHEPAYRSGVAIGLLANAFYIVVTALFYRLFAPVDRSLSLLAASFSLAGCTIQIVGGIFQLAPLVILTDGPLSSAFNAEQLQAAAFFCLKLYSQAFGVALVLFALYDLLIGYLIFKSTFLPRFLGVLLMLAGVGWLSFLWAPLATLLSRFVLPLGALAEIVLMLWLLVKGVTASPARAA